MDSFLYIWVHECDRLPWYLVIPVILLVYPLVITAVDYVAFTRKTPGLAYDWAKYLKKDLPLTYAVTGFVVIMFTLAVVITRTLFALVIWASQLSIL